MPGPSTTGVPIVLPTVRIHVGANGALTVTVDQEPYALPPGFSRDQVRGLLQDLADELGPIRIEITESTGEKYIDIQTPSVIANTPSESTPRPPATYGIRGQFESGEDVVVAVVVARRTAEANGTVALRLPPAFLERYGDDVVLLGQTTQASAALAGRNKGMAS